MSSKLIQSYVLDKYFVSTIHRESSTDPPMWFYETFGWEWDIKTREKGKFIIEEDSGIDPAKAIVDHANICRRLVEADQLLDNEY